ncbi:hypothetical protein MGN01_46840 [Methylobacterium gnaphalii]|uniref:Uncharacterized protein n=1 Tax=Methylobacterium gnaphalii TaxID=1010610 RepID=A0A512JSB8_9HYPH|nr:hypothetical protein MGN01_46840 [Methylobacterium gnaphalii]GLS50618.1 hypothetical protein GCM10007885_34710 [Methylobacterium gnaphalii]
MHDILASAWTYPENLRDQIIRARYEKQNDLPYVPEAARILSAMSQASAELIDANDASKVEAEVRRMISWFREKAGPSVEQAIATRRTS